MCSDSPVIVHHARYKIRGNAHPISLVPRLFFPAGPKIVVGTRLGDYNNLAFQPSVFVQLATAARGN